MPNDCLQALQKSKKSALLSGCIFRILLSRRMNYQPKEKKNDNAPKNGPKENKGKLEESKSPFLKKSKVLNELAWGHCEKRYNTWSCPIAVSRPCRNQKKSAFPSGCIFGILLSRRLDYRPKEKQKLRYFWLSRIWNGPKNRLKKLRKREEKKSPTLKNQSHRIVSLRALRKKL